MTDDLVALQGVDTGIDQLGHRRARLPEREALAAAERQHAASSKRVAAIEARQRELEAAVEEAEAQGAKLTSQRERLQAQLKTVIAPREAEALMAELDTLATRRNNLDDAELEQLEEQARLDDELAEVRSALPALDAATAAATAALRDAEATIDGEVAELAARRAELAAAIDAATLADYESRRRHFGGVAVATLEGRTCSGCHLDVSTSEVEKLKALPPGTLGECPQCGRILVP